MYLSASHNSPPAHTPNAAQPVGHLYTLSDGISDWQIFYVGLEKAIEVAELSKLGMKQVSFYYPNTLPWSFSNIDKSEPK